MRVCWSLLRIAISYELSNEYHIPCKLLKNNVRQLQPNEPITIPSVISLTVLCLWIHSEKSHIVGVTRAPVRPPDREPLCCNWYPILLLDLLSQWQCRNQYQKHIDDDAPPNFSNEHPEKCLACSYSGNVDDHSSWQADFGFERNGMAKQSKEEKDHGRSSFLERVGIWAFILDCNWS